METYPSIPQALRAVEDQEKIFVIGGGKIFSQLLERADELYLTIVDRDVEGDTFFPPYEHLLDGRFTLVNLTTGDGYTFADYSL